jgi:hypothetical protein
MQIFITTVFFMEIYCKVMWVATYRPIWDFRFSLRQVWGLESSGINRRVITLKFIDVSEVRTSSNIYRPDDEGITHLWNFGQLQRDCTALHHRRLNFTTYIPAYCIRGIFIPYFEKLLWIAIEYYSENAWKRDRWRKVWGLSKKTLQF